MSAPAAISGHGDLSIHAANAASNTKRFASTSLREQSQEETIADILWHNRRGVTAHYSVAQIVEIRDALELITDERNRFNKSLASLIREKSLPKVPKGRKKNGLGPDHLTRCVVTGAPGRI